MRIGVVGCGRNSRSHLREYVGMPGVAVVALADRIPGRAGERVPLQSAQPLTAFASRTTSDGGFAVASR